MRSILVVLTTALAACTSVLAQGTATMRTHSISMPYIGTFSLSEISYANELYVTDTCPSP